MSIPPAPPITLRPIQFRQTLAHQTLFLPTSKWPTEDLKRAARNGYASFLNDCKKSRLPIEFYMTLFRENVNDSNDQQYGNILHLAALNNREKFIAEVIDILHPSDIHKLLIQPQSPTKSSPNPLHIAASIGNISIVRLFLKALQSLPYQLNSHNKPWLQTFYDQTQTPQAQGYHTAVMYNSEDCALEILKMDMKEICRLYENRGNNSLLYAAVCLGFSRIALEILKSNLPFTYFASSGYTAFHVLPNCSEGEEICRLLLEKAPEIINKKANGGVSALHCWANEGKLWPFECVLNSSVFKQTFANLISATDSNGSNPLHNLAGFTRDENDAIKIAELLIKTYNDEQKAKATSSSSSISASNLAPWVVPNHLGQTPLSLAISRRYQTLAIYLLSIDKNVVKHFKESVLFLSIETQCLEVAEKIMDIVDEEGWNHLLYNDEKLNLLHLAPKCTENMCQRLLKKHPALLWEKDNHNNTVLHSWFRFGQVWPFKCLLEDEEILYRMEAGDYSFLDILEAYNKDTNNPFHVAANSTNKSMDVIIERLIDVYKDLASKIPRTKVVREFPWFVKNKENAGTLTLALRNQRQNLALHLLSILTDQFRRIEELLDHYPPAHTTLFIAMQNNCFKVVKDILIKIDKTNFYYSNYLQDTDGDRINIMHLAANCTDKEFGKWVVEYETQYITCKDRSGESPLEKAADAGADWIIPEMLKYVSRGFNYVSSAMVKACTKGHVSTIKLFMDHFGSPDYFKTECNRFKDSPLHHIDKLPDLKSYRQFLEIPGMKDLINLKNSKGNTPLHQAIRSQNRLLVQALILEKDIISYDIEDGKKITAFDLLGPECEKNSDMKKICTDAGIDPNARATYYFRSRTNMSDVRTTLSVVAALLATITFTAGFTIPGGFNQETGEAILAMKPAFLVFLISDTLAMCCSMLVLISLIWSMVFDSMEKPSQSLFLIDRSMVLLLLALYSTLLAFMTGVYVVTSPKSLWAAIVILVLCSLLVFAARKSFLYKILKYIIPSTKRKSQKLKMCNSKLL